MIDIVVLISGRGSNLQALIEQAQHYRIRAVVSNKRDAAGLSLAQQASISTISIPRQQDNSLIQHKHAIYAQIETLKPDLIVLAGFMQILEQNFTEQQRGKVVNIHPSLLPAFKGLDTHQRALDAYHASNGTKNKQGCSVHYVDYEVDSGALIAQAECPILPSDTATTLAARVLEQEHKLLPWIINHIANHSISYRDNQVIFSAEATTKALSLGFRIK